MHMRSNQIIFKCIQIVFDLITVNAKITSHKIITIMIIQTYIYIYIFLKNSNNCY
jgi:hypothetical protein